MDAELKRWVDVWEGMKDGINNQKPQVDPQIQQDDQNRRDAERIRVINEAKKFEDS